ncbi:MAG: hypothetical protein V2A56_09600, partial [bacterium]
MHPKRRFAVLKCLLLGVFVLPSTLSAQTFCGVLLEVSIGSLSDTENYAGFDDNATDAYDSGIDAPEPPAPVGDYVRLAFNPMAGAPESFTEFRTDWREPVELPLDSAVIWTFFISTTLDTGQVVLSVQLGDELDASLPVYLWDGNQYNNLRMTTSLNWTATAQTKRNMTLYIGSPGKPFVSVLGPSPNEELPPNEPVDCSWSVASTVTIQRTQVEFSLDGGTQFTVLADVDSLITACQWTTPDSGVTDGVFQVQVTDSIGQQASSSVSFHVLDPSSELTGIQLVSPAEGAVIDGGDSILVDWTWLGGTSNVSGAEIQTSTNQGNSWTTVYTSDDTLSRATWVVPEDVFTNDAYLRVVSTVTSGLVQQDSAVALTIRPPLLQ